MFSISDKKSSIVHAQPQEADIVTMNMKYQCHRICTWKLQQWQTTDMCPEENV